MLFLLLTTIALAEAPPKNICPPNYCQTGAQAIADQFDSAHTLSTEAVPYVASGECYHEGQRYDGRITQFGYTLIDTLNNNYYMNGAFAFFTQGNPYKNLTVAEARARTQDPYASHRKLSLTPTYAFVDMNPGGIGQALVRYWLREDANNLLLFGVMGLSHNIYCRLIKHE